MALRWKRGRRRWRLKSFQRLRRSLSVFVVVDLVHQRHELRDGIVELDILVYLPFHALYFHAERQHPLHVFVVVRDVEMRLRHEVFDEVARLGQEMLHHAPT